MSYRNSTNASYAACFEKTHTSAWLEAIGCSEWLTLAYAWNPFVVMEVAHSGHIDGLGALWLAAAAYWLTRRRTALATIAYVLAVATNEVTTAELSGGLCPTYMKILPATDGWGNRFRFRTSQAWNADPDADDYVVWSAARNGSLDGANGWDATSTSPGGATTNFNADIIFSQGVFVQYPEGLQSQ